MNLRINELRKKMLTRKIDAYIIPTTDPHGSEYVSDHYKTREFISGFTGSSGTVIITKDKAGLWTDGRYFIQAERELKNTEIKLYPMGQPDVPTMDEFLIEEVEEYGKIAFNGDTLSYHTYYDLMKKMGTRMLIHDVDYVGDIWSDRPQTSKEKAYSLPFKYSGKTTEDKLIELRKKMNDISIDYHFLGSLDDIAYLYNIRGNDIHCVPVVLSYALISQDMAILYIDIDKVDKELVDELSSQGVQVKPYSQITDDLSQIPAKSTLYFDPHYTNVTIYKSINSNVRFKKGKNLTTFMKAHKNNIEIENLRECYINDGVALVKFLHWIETGTPTGNVTEYSAAKKLDALRKELDGFKELSFDTISAYGENAALPHYKAPRISKTLHEKGFYLVDSGGQYLTGTTDITRTIALGPLTLEEKKHYTLVLKSHITLMNTKFSKGTPAHSLDAIARQPLWKEGLDFIHGTGHGVGYFLSCHEGPQSISKAISTITMDEGMVTSNEPGLYIENKHGIRIENIMLCKKEVENEFGTFLGFECLSCCPIDTRPVIKDMLTKEELAWLNEYNLWCYEKLKDKLEGSDLEYLERSCVAI